MLRTLSGILLLLALAVPSAAGPGEAPRLDSIILIEVDDDLIEFRHKEQENWTPLFFDMLYQWVPGPNGAELKPCIAAGWPEWSDDMRSCTIKLRETAVFDDFPGFVDGKARRVEAADIIFSLKFFAMGVSKYKFAYDGLLRDRITGLDDFAKKYGDGKRPDWNLEVKTTDIEGIVAKGTYEIQFKLTRPCGHLAALLADPFLFIWPPELIETPREQRQRGKPFVGTGPMLPTDAESSMLNLSPRPKYYAEPTAPPPLRRVSGKTQTATQALEAVSRNELSYWRVPESELLAAARARAEHTNIHFEDAEVVHYLGFNMARPIWGGSGEDSSTLRRCVSDSIDRAALARETQNYQPWRESRSLLPPIRGRVQPIDQVLPQPLAADAIKKLVGQSRLKNEPDNQGNVFKLVVLCEEDSHYKPALAQISAPLAQLGIAVEWKVLRGDKFAEALAARDYDAVFLGWSNDWPDALCMLEKLHSRNADRLPLQTVPCAYESREYDKLLEKAESIPLGPTSSAEREKAIGECLKHLASDMPYVPIAVPQRAWVAQPDIDVPQVPASGRNTLRFLKFK